jgi:hypothetical protein
MTLSSFGFVFHSVRKATQRSNHPFKRLLPTTSFNAEAWHPSNIFKDTSVLCLVGECGPAVFVIQEPDLDSARPERERKLQTRPSRGFVFASSVVLDIVFIEGRSVLCVF